LINFVDNILKNYDENNQIFIDDSHKEWVTKSEFKKKIDYWLKKTPNKKSLIFAYIDNRIEHLAFTFACLKKNHCVALLDSNLPYDSANNLNEKYKPNFIFHEHNGSVTLKEFSKENIEIYDENYLMLSTSGSTGSPKFVVLSNENLSHNAIKISDILRIDKESIGAGYLPFHYSYGLSVITSHLISGAKVVLSNLSIMQSEFWKTIEEKNVNHFPGVPFHYEMMHKLGFERLGLNKIKTMTQAGGHLDMNLRKATYDYIDKKGGSFFVMYGQTEASPRITTLKHEDFLNYSNSVGEALEDGLLTIEDEYLNNEGYEEGTIFYEGPNVMLRYAKNIEDLSKKPNDKRKINTGDIGYIKDNKLFITGRLKRFAKIYGLRVNLDEVQKILNQGEDNFAIIERKEKLIIFCEGDSSEAIEDDVKEKISSKFTIPLNSVIVKFIDKLPVNARGKTDFKSLNNF
tara:strand:+ start:2061 stop:3437 length:1377 start_codon:yes stop_codon:yes gene_type:complete